MELELECQCDIEKAKVDPTRSLQWEKKNYQIFIEIKNQNDTYLFTFHSFYKILKPFINFMITMTFII
jgi:hypothetical protein